MQFGLIGYLNSGRKTIFELLTGKPLSEKYSGSIGEAIPGIVHIRDQRLEKLSQLYQPQKTTPATVEFFLAPDFVHKSDSSGKNAPAAMFQVLERMDVIGLVVRDFADDAVFYVEGSVDAVRDIRVMQDELLIHDQIFLEKRIERIRKDMKSKTMPEKVKEMELLENLLRQVEDEKPLRSYSFKKDDLQTLTSYPLLTRKPMMIILNVNEDKLSGSTKLAELQEEFAAHRYTWLQLSAKLENELSHLDPADRVEFFKELGIETSALEKLTRTAYEMLGLISYFTVGKDEVRSWMVRKDSTASRAARVIHADIERGFIRAELMKYDDLIRAGSEQKVKDAGKFYLKGKDYIVEDGDIFSFRFNV